MDTNRQNKVLQCVIDLFHARRPANRVLIAQYLNEKLSVVDDAVKRLKEDGLLRTVVPGYVEPVEQFPPDEAISTTVLPNGRWKIEKGDQCMECTPHEAQVLGKMLQGPAMEMAYWYEERQQGAQLVRQEAQIRALQHELAAVRERLTRPPAAPASPQRDLFHRPVRRRRPIDTTPTLET
jgi:hypothetical protein